MDPHPPNGNPPRAALVAFFVLSLGVSACKGSSDAAPAPTTTTAIQNGLGDQGLSPGQPGLNQPQQQPAQLRGRSPVPSTSEWSAASEVGVTGSTKLHCETKMVREWLRVSCSGKSASGGTPVSVTVTKGGNHGDTFTFASAGVSSLVCPVVDGTDIEATFTWSDGSHVLRVKWPHGAPPPTLKGAFD